MGWSEFVTAFIAFFLTHSVPLRPPLRGWLVGRLGQTGFSIAYSILSLGVLTWLITAAGRAPHVPLWYWAPWQNAVPLVGMLAVCLILALAIGRPNPFSFGGGQGNRFDPAHPGIVRWMRHPLLVALAIWALSHIVPNGDLAHVIVFASFAAFAILGQRLIDRRKVRIMAEAWHRLNRETRAAPAWPGWKDLRGSGLRLGIGLALYGMLICLHPIMFGAYPFP